MTNEKSTVETSDVQVKPAALTGVLILVGLVVIIFLLRLIFNYSHSAAVSKVRWDKTSNFNLDAEEQGQMPLLQRDDAADMRVMLQEEEKILHSYGWEDKAAGIVRIPIEQAMDIVVKQGLPTRSGTR
jgi:hypothetical protein